MYPDNRMDLGTAALVLLLLLLLLLSLLLSCCWHRTASPAMLQLLL
jgi:hypothetical protein